MAFNTNVTKKGEVALKKLASDERMINYNNLFFKRGNPSIENFDFFKRFGTLYNLVIDLLNEEISINEAEQ